jgi:hypothetical protein
VKPNNLSINLSGKRTGKRRCRVEQQAPSVALVLDPLALEAARALSVAEDLHAASVALAFAHSALVDRPTVVLDFAS